jgi:hypothetical protein
MGRHKLPVPQEDIDGIMQVTQHNMLKPEVLYYITVGGEGVFSANGMGVRTYRTPAIALANFRKAIIKHNGFDFNTARRYASIILERGLIEIKKVEIDYTKQQTQDESTRTVCGE